MPHTDLPPRRRHYIEVRLVAGDVVYTGKGATEQVARASAKNLAKRRGLNAAAVKALTELDVRSLVGRVPRTFQGNKRVPEPA